jgi:hypothetical protein
LLGLAARIRSVPKLDSARFPSELLAQCPELAWPDHEQDKGVYMAFGLGILPMLRLLLDPDGPHPSPDHPQETVRQRMQRERYFSAAPQPGSAAAESLLQRLYAFIEHAAQHGDQIVQQAIGIELGEFGHGRLSVDDLLARAGPGTRALAVARRPPERPGRVDQRR